TNKLVEEAYERSKENIRVEHILLLVTRGGVPADTLAVKKRIDSIYNAIVNKGANFEDMARKYSQDEGSRIKGGDIGYITALQTVYDFENGVYNTKEGQISKP